MEALYRVNVQPYEAVTTLDPLLEQFKETVAVSAQPLFSTRRTSRRPAVLKSFLLYELLQPEPQLAVCEHLLQELPPGAFGAIDHLIREKEWVVHGGRRRSGRVRVDAPVVAAPSDGKRSLLDALRDKTVRHVAG